MKKLKKNNRIDRENRVKENLLTKFKHRKIKVDSWMGKGDKMNYQSTQKERKMHKI